MVDELDFIPEFLRVAELCKQAEVPDPNLDRAIFNCVAKGLYWPETQMYWYTGESGLSRVPLLFTQSLDAAEVLIPPSRFTELITQDRHSRRWKRVLRGGCGVRSEARGQTLALTTCAAALRAHVEVMKEAKAERLPLME